MKTSDFSTEMDELFLWIDETENVLASYVTLDEKSLDETLEKIKVWKFVYSGVYIRIIWIGVEALMFNHADLIYMSCSSIMCERWGVGERWVGGGF